MSEMPERYSRTQLERDKWNAWQQHCKKQNRPLRCVSLTNPCTIANTVASFFLESLSDCWTKYMCVHCNHVWLDRSPYEDHKALVNTTSYLPLASVRIWLQWPSDGTRGEAGVFVTILAIANAVCMTFYQDSGRLKAHLEHNCEQKSIRYACKNIIYKMHHA